jgi:hypothetical protein
VEWKGGNWIELNRVSVSPYVPALSSEVEKNPASIAASEKNRKRGCAHGDNMAVLWRMWSRFSRKIKTQHTLKKNSGDFCHQALTYFSFSEFLSSDFRHNKFLKYLKENNMANFVNLLWRKSDDKNSEKPK